MDAHPISGVMTTFLRVQNKIEEMEDAVSKYL
jgi:hypothetical protein